MGRCKNLHLINLLAISVAPIVAVDQSAQAQGTVMTKAAKVEAAYLYNFAKFIQWPQTAFERADSPFVVGVFGDDNFYRILSSTVKGKTIAGRSIQVRRIHSDSLAAPAALRHCHMIYIGAREQAQVSAVIHAVGNQPVLLVSSIKEFARSGGMIGFVVAEGHILFEISRRSLERANLKASSKLMRLAKQVG